MTRRPISTISFNTPEYLDMKCKELLEDEIIQTYIYIFHHAEQDTKKDHIHLYLSPARNIDPMKIRKLFIEPCLDKRGDLGCLPFNPSKLCDWFLYALHNPIYLLRKGLSRVNVYNISQFVSNESHEYLEQVYHDSLEQFEDSRISLFLSRLDNGASLGELLASGLVPPNQVVFYEKLYKSNARRIGSKLDENFNEQIPF